MIGLRSARAASSERLASPSRDGGGGGAGRIAAAPSEPASTPRRRGEGKAWRAWGRLRPRLVLALPVLLLASALACGLQAWRLDRANRIIAALDEGDDVAVTAVAPAPVLAARVGFLARRGRLEEAEPLLVALDGGDDRGEAARARYRVANARMRDAFGLLARGALDKAGPQVTLARQDYRRALRDRPDFWDAKFNLDVASRLIRDYPELNRTDGDALKAEPKTIWTDIPGQPRGGP